MEKDVEDVVMADYNYRMTIQYDGTRYRGWQVQSNTEDTIQGKLEKVIGRLLDCEIQVIGSGRTDAGVHAIGQIANFHSSKKLDEQQFFIDVNKYLPEDISVIAVEAVDSRFHARYSAIEKTYRYRIHTGIATNVFERKYVYPYRDLRLDIVRMQKAASYMLGEHDFKCFCGNKHMKKSTVRTVTGINIRQTENEIVIDYTGDGFLKNMIRIMTGTLIEVGNGTKNPEDVKEIIAGLDRENAGYTAPPAGLCLVEVRY